MAGKLVFCVLCVNDVQHVPASIAILTMVYLHGEP